MRGCVWRTYVRVWSAPDEFASPNVDAVSSSAVLVSWSQPGRPNGVIIGYIVQRRSATDGDVLVVGRVSGETFGYLDESASLRPYTEYQYRVGAQTSAGVTNSTWAGVVTRLASQSCRAFIVFTRATLCITGSLCILRRWMGTGAGVKNTRMMRLSGRERSLTTSSTVWIQYTNVTGRRSPDDSNAYA